MSLIRIALFLGLFAVYGSSSAQTQKNIRWVAKVNYICGNEAEVQLTAMVNPGWHLYAPNNPPFPTEFSTSFPAFIKAKGEFKGPKAIEEEDEYLGPVAYYKDQNIVFRMPVEIQKSEQGIGTVEVRGQICTDSDEMCLPFEQTLKITFQLPERVAPCQGKGNETGSVATDDPLVLNEDSDGDGVPDHLDECPGEPGRPEWDGCPDSDGDGIPDHLDRCPGVYGEGEDGCPVQGSGMTGFSPERMGPEVQQRLSEDGTCGDGADAGGDLTPWGILIAGIIGGLFALLTPCVFPMIPLTVSFFTKQSGNRAKGLRNAMIYALSIIVIYTGLGWLIAVMFGADALNAMATSAFWNLVFFLIFFIFALSFLGAFEIVLPARFVNAVDKGSNRGGLIGIFFMAFTLSLVSFSCTGPIIGTLLVEASTKGSMAGPLLGMFGFSLSLAVPFALFAAFPGWLNSLPRSGGWLNSVKVTLGFLELALALKFLSTVDMAYHWDFLYRDRFIAIWIAIFGMLSLYLLGLFRAKSDSAERPELGVPRILMAVLTLSFTVYLVPGLSGHPLRLLAGIAPPLHYREDVSQENHCPHDIPCFNDMDEGAARARIERKPIFLDFTGYGCTNCRLMEENVWIDPASMRMLKEDFVVVSLYVDDKTPLPAGKSITSPLTGEPITKTGKKWSDFQQYYFGLSAQPLYVILAPDGSILAAPYGYDASQEKFRNYLRCGLDRM
jgi:cytochrome c biogenesis protein CcdA